MSRIATSNIEHLYFFLTFLIKLHLEDPSIPLHWEPILLKYGEEE
jgi:hypothetical protein